MSGSTSNALALHCGNKDGAKTGLIENERQKIRHMRSICLFFGRLSPHSASFCRFLREFG